MKRVAVIWLIALAAAASADSNDADDRNAAARLFEEARKMKHSGYPDEACERFEKSYKLDPAAGTALNLGECAERASDWHRAWTLYDAAATYFVKKRDPRAKFARDHADRVLSAHADADVEPKAPVVEQPPPRTERDKRTGLKVATGAAFGVAAIAGIWWFLSYQTIQDVDEGPILQAGSPFPASFPEQCGTPTTDITGGAAQAKWNAGCAAYDRTQWLLPTTLVAGAVGTGLLIYLLVSTPKEHVVVTPTVSNGAAGVTATIRW